MENYIALEMIGEGAFGKVYKGQRKCTNQIVAIKKIVKKGKSEKDLKNLRQEIDISRRLYHENIIQLLDSFETNNEFCLVSEFATGQLYEVIEEDKRLPESEIRKITQQLTSALYYLHENNIIHRDIKPQNILLSANGVIKICDFGFARFFDNKTMITSIKGTPLYMAPELLSEYPYNKKADLWSLGVILYELFVGQPPFYTNSFQTLMKKIHKEDIRYPDSMTPQFKYFLKGLLHKNPKDRWDWPKILSHPFLKETEEERNEKMDIQENYRKWIIRLKNDKIFNLYESKSYLQKFANNTEVESGTRNFSTFDINDSKTQSSKRLSSGSSASNANSNINSKEDFWSVVESKATNEEGATALRKDPIFADKVVSSLKAIIKDDNITDKKLALSIIKIVIYVLTKGRFDNQSIDITKNQAILTTAITIFKISQQDENYFLLNDIIKVIGLFIKFYCYYSNGIDLSICNGFLRYVPNVLTTPGRAPNLHINMLKAVGLMITAANIVPKRSLLFYKSIIDFNIINVLVQVIKNNKNQQFLLTKSCLECLAILIFPINGDIHAFPFLRNENMENKFDGYNDVKTAFSHIELLKKHCFQVCLDEKIFELFPTLYESENDASIKATILKILLQFLRFNPKEIFHYFTTTNSVYVKIINSAMTSADMDKKNIIHLGILNMIEIVKFGNMNSINVIDFGYEIQTVLNYLNKIFQTDGTILCLTFGLLSECMAMSSKFNIFNPKFLKIIKETIRNSPGRGRDENKKLEGTSFGYPSIAILDYPLLYLEKIVKLFTQRDKYKAEILTAVMETQFEDVLIEIISNSSFKNEISPRGVSSTLNIIADLIGCEYKMIIRKVLREHCIKHLIIFIKRKQYIAIQDWPGYKNNIGLAIAQSIFITTLRILKTASELNGINEEIAKGDFFFNLRNSFDIIGKDNYRLVIAILNAILSMKRDEVVLNLIIEHFSKENNLKFIDTFGLLTDTTNKELVSEVLSFLSALCRKSADVYVAINQLSIFPTLKMLIESTESSIKSRVCNLLGNMCRHTDYFYDQIKTSGIIKPLFNCCYDADKATRKFACFFIGNAAFLNDKLYESFRPIIPRMVELLSDPEDNTRANSAGAIGNFVRCGDVLCRDIISSKAHEALLKLAENEGAQQIQIIRVALFALGNFCNHASIRSELDKINFRARIEALRNKYRNDNQLLEHIERIKKKLKED